MELQKTLAGLWSKGKNALAGMQGQAPGVRYDVPAGGDLWLPPAGGKWGAPSYSLAPDGQVARNMPGGPELFTPTPDQQAQFAKAGWDAFAPGQAAPAADVYKELPATNALGSEKARTVTNALASALAAGQANRPKLTQAPASSAGSVLQPKNTLLDLLAQTSVRRAK